LDATATLPPNRGKSWLNHAICAAHALHDVIHVGHTADLQLFGDAVEVQACSTGQNFNAARCQIFQILQGLGTLAGQLCTAVVEQNRIRSSSCWVSA
jgi:hypothetical protein